MGDPGLWHHFLPCINTAAERKGVLILRTDTEELVGEPGLWHHFLPCINTAAERKGVLDTCDQAGACLQAPHSCRICPQCRCVLQCSSLVTRLKLDARWVDCSHQAITRPCSQASQAHMPLPRTACSLG